MVLFQKLFDIGVATGMLFFPKLTQKLLVYERALKFVFAGGCCGVVDVFLLFALVHFGDVHYLPSSIIAFVVSFGCSFYLQKNWTFAHTSSDKIHRQLVAYLALALFNLGINTVLMYAFVTLLGVWYVLAQIMAALLIALYSFFINKFYIFCQSRMPERRFKVLIAAAAFPPDSGGAQLHAAQYVAAFPKHGIDVRLVIFSRLLWLPFGIRHAVYLAKLFSAARGVDCIYAQDTNSTGWAAFMVAFLFRKPLLYRIGGDLLWERLAEWGKIDISMREFYARGLHKKFFLYHTVRWSLHRADAVIVPSQMLADVYTQHYGLPTHLLHVVPNPLPAHRDLGYVKEERTIVFASRLVKYKNLDRILDVFAKARYQQQSVRVLIFGDGPELEHLRDRVVREGLSACVEILGFASEEVILRATQASLGTIAPALTEFNPNYVLRGFVYHKPTLISREHGLPFAVPDMLMFDPTNTAELEEKLRYLLTAEGYLKAKQWVDALDFHQTWEDVILSTITIIKELCAS